MFSINPFAQVAAELSPGFMQTYVVLMVLAVIAGTLLYVAHKGSARFYARRKDDSRSRAARELGGGEKFMLAVETAAEAAVSGEFCKWPRRLSHLLMMYGFIFYVAATAVLVFSYPESARPDSAAPAFWTLGALMVLVGGLWFFFFLRVNVAYDGDPPYHLGRADLFVASLILSVLAGLVWNALGAAGAEVVAGDADDQGSLERAFAGAHGAFLVTNFWEHFSPERELAQAGALARASKAAGVTHAVWSTLEDTRLAFPLDDPRLKTLHGKYKVPHFDAKGEADRFFREAGVPTTFLYASYYWDNLIYFGAGPAKGEDGKLYLTLPTAGKKMAGIAAEDIGRVAYGIFKAGSRYIGQRVGAAGEQLTGAEMADKLSRALGREVRHNAMTPEAYRQLGFPGADDLQVHFRQVHRPAFPHAALQVFLNLRVVLGYLDPALGRAHVKEKLAHGNTELPAI